LGVWLAGACGGGGGKAAERVCRTQHGATVCFVRQRAGRGPWELEARGLQPGSELRSRVLGVSDDAPPLAERVGPDGSIGGASGVVVPTGRVTVALEGTARDGSAVRIEVTLRA
jgi:hypothetical protein